MAGFAEKGVIKSGVTSLAGFAGIRFPQKRGSRTTTPAAVTGTRWLFLDAHQWLARCAVEAIQASLVR